MEEKEKRKRTWRNSGREGKGRTVSMRRSEKRKSKVQKNEDVEQRREEEQEVERVEILQLKKRLEEQNVLE